MDRMRRVWGRLGAALTALVLVSLVAGPILDAAICQEQPGAVAETLADAGAPADQSHEDAEPCLHGHCHHGGAFTMALVGVQQAPMGPAGTSPKLLRARVAVTDPQFGLMRPPRA